MVGGWTGLRLAQRHRGLEESTERVNISIPSDVSFALFQGNIYDIIMTMLVNRLFMLFTCLMKNEATKQSEGRCLSIDIILSQIPSRVT